MSRSEGLPLIDGEVVVGKCGTITLTNRRVIDVLQEVHIFGLVNGDHTYQIIDLPSVNHVAAGEYMSVLRTIVIILMGLVIFKLGLLLELFLTFRRRPFWGRSVALKVASAAGSIEIMLERGGVEEAREFVKRLQAAKLALIANPAERAAPSVPIVASPRPTCPACRTPVATGAAFCEECGQNLA